MKLLTPEDLFECASKYELSLNAAHRDYAACRIAWALSSDGEVMNKMALKGGFIMRHGYGSLRTSKDIDGTIGTRHQDVDPKRVQRLVHTLCRDLNPKFNPKAAQLGKDSLSFGAIEYFNALGQGFVGLEMSFREDLASPARWVTIDKFGIPPFNVRCLSVNEMIAEKWRAFVQRSPRRLGDPYDLWYFWNKVKDHPKSIDDIINAQEVKKIVDQKINYSKSGYDVRQSLQQYGKVWNKEAGKILPSDFPPFQEVERCILSAAKAWTNWL